MDIREKFLNYFKQKGHLVLPSASLVPEDDPSVLLTTAGMQPFKPYYLGIKKPPKTRISTVQKCFRTSDIDSVGYTDRHLTFFEMLGNFSFGDYFKKEAINFALDFIINYLDLKIDRLWVAIFKGEGNLPRDHEAHSLWLEEGISKKRIVEYGKSENFWGPAGDTGPCGPCTEIYYDFGPEVGCGKKDCSPSCDCGRFLEIWNLVFTQYNFNGKEYVELPSKNIDTGMGLERIAAVLEGKFSVFDTKLFSPIINKIKDLSDHISSNLSPQEYQRALRVVADHCRAIYFLIADGVIPANEGRGYILRRIIRRAIRFGKLLGIKGYFLNDLGQVLIDNYKGPYPELAAKQKFAFKIISDEEERFSKTLKQGSKVLASTIENLKFHKNDYIDPKDAFRLYETYGFPVEVTREILQENNLKLDMDQFEHFYRQHVAKSKQQTVFDKKVDHKLDLYKETARKCSADFTGYQALHTSTQVTQLFETSPKQELSIVGSLKEGQKGEIILKSTPFYAEKGGQAGDKGKIYTDKFLFEVEDTQVPVEGVYIHQGRVSKGTVNIGDMVEAEVEISFRKDISKNHTATHLLHWALKAVLGAEINQAGSSVENSRFRFDFLCYQAPTKEQLDKVEMMVNAKIQNNDIVKIFETSKEYAQEIGAIALFDEKYGDFVRVVEIDNYSRELCGGTHVSRTGELGLFKIISESSIGANTRRIEAITGMHAYNMLKQKAIQADMAARILGVDQLEVIKGIEALKNSYDQLSAQMENIKIKQLRDDISSKLPAGQDGKKIKIIAQNLIHNPLAHGLDAQSLADIGDQIKDLNQQKSTVIILGHAVNNKPVLILQATPDLVKKGLNLGKIAKESGKLLNGGGGGKPDFAQSGGSQLSKIDEAINFSKQRILEQCD